MTDDRHSPGGNDGGNDGRDDGLDDGGDAACWLAHVCVECGALLEHPLPALCWRCGAEAIPQ